MKMKRNLLAIGLGFAVAACVAAKEPSFKNLCASLVDENSQVVSVEKYWGSIPSDNCKWTVAVGRDTRPIWILRKSTQPWQDEGDMEIPEWAKPKPVRTVISGRAEHLFAGSQDLALEAKSPDFNEILEKASKDQDLKVHVLGRVSKTDGVKASEIASQRSLNVAKWFVLSGVSASRITVDITSDPRLDENGAVHKFELKDHKGKPIKNIGVVEVVLAKKVR